MLILSSMSLDTNRSTETARLVFSGDEQSFKAILMSDDDIVDESEGLDIISVLEDFSLHVLPSTEFEDQFENWSSGVIADIDAGYMNGLSSQRDLDSLSLIDHAVSVVSGDDMVDVDFTELLHVLKNQGAKPMESVLRSQLMESGMSRSDVEKVIENMSSDKG